MTIDDALQSVRQAVREPVQALLGIPPAGKRTQISWTAYQALCDVPLELVAQGWQVAIGRTPAGAWSLTIAAPIAGRMFQHEVRAPSYAGACSELAFSLAGALDAHQLAQTRAAKRTPARAQREVAA